MRNTKFTIELGPGQKFAGKNLLVFGRGRTQRAARKSKNSEKELKT